jgi:hypothetical protein
MFDVIENLIKNDFCRATAVKQMGDWSYLETPEQLGCIRWFTMYFRSNT